MGQSLPKAVTSIVLEEDVLASGIESTPFRLARAMRWLQMLQDDSTYDKIWNPDEYTTGQTDKGSSVAFS